ncbi:hypothetical protein B0H16DRAFT_1747967 [Mycena metata]|uniref:Uncharacterized protein n=1 Tax=Mycena metata TaxID=1033252 RepID=A0AAD7E0Y8_9AGAR|nr:hypothetical protein B0H16DRAFT_1747967 [Mycena metata]
MSRITPPAVNRNPYGPAPAAAPPFCGWIETTDDVLLIVEAARRGLIPCITRRLASVPTMRLLHRPCNSRPRVHHRESTHAPTQIRVECTAPHTHAALEASDLPPPTHPCRPLPLLSSSSRTYLESTPGPASLSPPRTWLPRSRFEVRVLYLSHSPPTCLDVALHGERGLGLGQPSRSSSYAPPTILCGAIHPALSPAPHTPPSFHLTLIYVAAHDAVRHRAHRAHCQFPVRGPVPPLQTCAVASASRGTRARNEPGCCRLLLSSTHTRTHTHTTLPPRPSLLFPDPTPLYRRNL